MSAVISWLTVASFPASLAALIYCVRSARRNRRSA